MAKGAGYFADEISQSQNENKPQTLPQVVGELNGHRINIALARTVLQRTKGLMFAKSLDENKGMLFVYKAPKMMVFWMKNTKIPLDLVFFSPDLQITECIEGMVPGFGKKESELPRYSAKYPAQYALELPAGSIRKFELKPGDVLKIPLTFLYSE